MGEVKRLQIRDAGAWSYGTGEVTCREREGKNKEKETENRVDEWLVCVTPSLLSFMWIQSFFINNNNKKGRAILVFKKKKKLYHDIPIKPNFGLKTPLFQRSLVRLIKWRIRLRMVN